MSLNSLINKDHNFYVGSIYHKRYIPKVHEFKYNYFLLDINTSKLEKLKNAIFSYNKFNLFSFKSIDHFGKVDNFNENIKELLKKFNLNENYKTRFITLPRVFNHVFNPISCLLVFNENEELIYALSEVHNYNGGRVVYPVKLEKTKNNSYTGKIDKDMYVSPFFDRLGEYDFIFKYSDEKLFIQIDLYEENQKKLSAILNTKSVDFNTKNNFKIFFRYGFTTFVVVLGTMYQAVRLYLKKLKIYKPLNEDKIRRF